MSCQAIYPKEGNIIYMNSCGEGSRKVAHCLKAVRWEIKNPHQVMVYKFYTNLSFFNKRGFMDTKGFKGATWKCVKLPHSLQPDATSCGVFVCKVSSCNNCFYNCITLVHPPFSSLQKHFFSGETWPSHAQTQTLHRCVKTWVYAFWMNQVFLHYFKKGWWTQKRMR